MTDTNTSNTEMAPVVADDGTGGSEFDAQLNDFLGFSFADEPPLSGDAGSGEAPAEGSGISPPQGDQSSTEKPVVPAPVAPKDPPAGQGNADSPAPKDGQPAGEQGVDQTLLAQILGAAPAPQPVAQPAPAPVPAPTPGAPQGESPPAPAEEDWTPFPSTMTLPPAMVSALFESDDSNVRAQALVSLLVSYGNTITSLTEKRIREVHAPSIQGRVQSAQAEQEQARAVNTDFYGAFPDLAPFKELVKKTFLAVQQANPAATYNQQTRDQVGNLAREAAKRMGLITAPAPAPAAASPAPAAKKPAPYLAGGARPGAITAPDSNLEEAFAGLDEF